MVSDVMIEKVITAEADYTVRHAATIMSEFGVGCLVVFDNQRIIGIVTERDILKRLVASGRDPEKTLVTEIMSRPVIVVEPERPLDEAIKLMFYHKITKLPVVKNLDGETKLVGLATLTDVARLEPTLINTLKEMFDQTQQAPPKSMEKVMNFYIS